MSTTSITPDATAFPAQQVEQMLFAEKSRTTEAFQNYQRMARVVRDLDRENKQLRNRLNRRSWLARYMSLVRWARQPKQNSQSGIPGCGLDMLVVGLTVVFGVAATFAA